MWDTIEFDKAVGVGRAILNATPASRANNLVIVTADHDQSMSIIGVVDTNVPSVIQNVIATLPHPNGNRRAADGQIKIANAVGETSGFPNYEDANGDRYPENANRYRLKVGFRTGNHTGSSVPVTAEGAGALLFFGYYDQTDLFFKMAKSLTLNTTVLDQVLTLKQTNDVPCFTPDTQIRSEKNKGMIMLKSEPLYTQRVYGADEDRFGHDEEEHHQEDLNKNPNN